MSDREARAWDEGYAAAVIDARNDEWLTENPYRSTPAGEQS